MNYKYLKFVQEVRKQLGEELAQLFNKYRFEMYHGNREMPLFISGNRSEPFTDQSVYLVLCARLLDC